MDVMPLASALLIACIPYLMCFMLQIHFSARISRSPCGTYRSVTC
jgi:hypothetical protein